MAASQLIQKWKRFISFLKRSIDRVLFEGETLTSVQETLLSLCGRAAEDMMLANDRTDR
jgi:hypothetical protein